MSCSLVRKQIDIILNAQFSQDIVDRIAVLGKTLVRSQTGGRGFVLPLSLGHMGDLISGDSEVKLKKKRYYPRSLRLLLT